MAGGEHRAAVACGGRCGTERVVGWNEATGVVGADGWVLDAVGPDEGVARAEVDLAASRDERVGEHTGPQDDRRPRPCGAVTADSGW